MGVPFGLQFRLLEYELYEYEYEYEYQLPAMWENKKEQRPCLWAKDKLVKECW